MSMRRSAHGWSGSSSGSAKSCPSSPRQPGRRSRLSPSSVELLIERLSQLGDGVAHHEGRTVFVPGALPGERVRGRIVNAGKVLRAEGVEVLAASPERRAPSCPVAGSCGGCDWLHVSEGVQRTAKQEVVLSALEHLGEIDRSGLEVRPMIASPRKLAYRRRLVLHPGGGKLGFFGRRSHEHVAVDACPAAVDLLSGKLPLLNEALGSILKDVEEVTLLAESDRASFAVRLKGGVKARHLEVAERALRVVGVEGVVLVAQAGQTRVVGRPALASLSPLHPEVPLYLRPDAFAQANAEANLALSASALTELGPREGDRVLELYCGNGNFSFAIAAVAAELVGVESSGVGLELARRSAAEGGVRNVRWVQGDVPKVCRGLIAEGARFDLLLLDPPRTGAPGLASLAKGLGVRRVVYIACDPASLARDAGELAKAAFRPRSLQVVDLFPQTRHVEAVMALDAP